MHPNNIHNKKYDFAILCKNYIELKSYVFTNKFNTLTIDFANPKAVKALNTALLITYHHVKDWHFSDRNLCPPIPSRADYIYYLNDLINIDDSKINILDIGTGASCIYPLLGNAIYNWNFVGSDIDTDSLNNAQLIINNNNLNTAISLRLQKDKSQILNGILNSDDSFTATMCNPPFYKSLNDANIANKRKLKNLHINSTKRNFSGINNELWYDGGEKAFLHNYLYESSLHKNKCTWFTSLVSKKENVKSMFVSLKKLKATDVKTIEMLHGNKITRIVAWRFN